MLSCDSEWGVAPRHPEYGMASLLIRNVDDALRAQLKARAHIHGRSLEE